MAVSVRVIKPFQDGLKANDSSDPGADYDLHKEIAPNRSTLIFPVTTPVLYFKEIRRTAARPSIFRPTNLRNSGMDVGFEAKEPCGSTGLSAWVQVRGPDPRPASETELSAFTSCPGGGDEEVSSSLTCQLFSDEGVRSSVKGRCVCFGGAAAHPALPLGLTSCEIDTLRFVIRIAPHLQRSLPPA